MIFIKTAIEVMGKERETKENGELKSRVPGQRIMGKNWAFCVKNHFFT